MRTDEISSDVPPSPHLRAADGRVPGPRGRPASVAREPGAGAIVVRVESGPGARTAQLWAARHARERGGPLRLIGTVMPPWGTRFGELTSPDHPRQLTARAMVDRAADLAADWSGDADVEAELRCGPPARILLDETRSARLLVLSAPAPPSVLAAVLDGTACPVVVVGEARQDGPGPVTPVVTWVRSVPSRADEGRWACPPGP